MTKREQVASYIKFCLGIQQKILMLRDNEIGSMKQIYNEISDKISELTQLLLEEVADEN